MNSPVTGPVIGVVGGGQLARMMAPAATALGVELRVLAEGPEVAAVAAVRTAPEGDYTDLETLRHFAADVDILTFDHEHVPTEHLRALESEGIAVRPGPDALEHAQDKLVMRRAVERLGLPNPQWADVASPEQLVDFGERVGWPVVLKTPRGGYDGKGVLRVEGPQDAAQGTAAEWFERSAAEGGRLLAEETVPFRRELSAMVARRPSGETTTWPVVESIQVDGVCDEVIAPAPDLDPRLDAAARDAAVLLAEELGVTGVMAVELFETPGTHAGFAVNELAMRPHNSGHWSMDGSVTGQFEQHLRAVLDLPLGATAPVGGATVMKNVLGGENQDLFAAYPAAMAAEPRAKIHTYGKAVRPGRKIGHVNAVGGLHELEALRRAATRAAGILRDGAEGGESARVNTRSARAPWGAVPDGQSEAPLVGLVMGSDSDWATMRAAAAALEELGIPYEADVVSAHRMPAEMLEYGRTAHERGLRVVIAGAGGAAHLPGMLASVTPLPVIGVPVALQTLDGMDSLLSIVQMPAGVPVATVSVNGARNAGLLAARVLGSAGDASGDELRGRLLDAAAELSEAAHRKGAALRTAVSRGASAEQ